MIHSDKKYFLLGRIGLFALIPTMLFIRYIENDVVLALITGFIVGWLLAIFILKHLELKEEIEKGKKKSEQMLQEIQKSIKS